MITVLDRPATTAAPSGDLFYQCLLGQADVRTVGWIEARGAKVGARVEVKGEAGLWDVLAVYSPPQDIRWLRDKQAIDRAGLPSLRGKKRR